MFANISDEFLFPMNARWLITFDMSVNVMVNIIRRTLMFTDISNKNLLTKHCMLVNYLSQTTV